MYNRFCLVLVQEGGFLLRGVGQAGNRRAQDDILVSVLGQGNWVGFEIPYD